MSDPIEELTRLMNRFSIPGLSMVTLKGGAIHSSVSLGYADASKEVPVGPETLFEAASISKPVFAFYVLMLAEKGLLDLDRPLHDALKVPYCDDPRIKKVTARHVLTHTSGLPNWRPEGKALILGFDPGERFSYSGEGFVFLQHVVESMMGDGLDVLLAEAVFKPSGMTTSSTIWREDFKGRMALGHDAAAQPAERRQFDTPNAAYSLVTTPEDFSRFMSLLLQPSESAGALLSREGIAAYLSPAVQVNDLMPWSRDWPDGAFHLNKKVFWGLGIGLQQMEKGMGFWHWGDNGNFHAFFMGNPDAGSGLMVMVNGENGKGFWEPFFQRILGQIPEGLRWLQGS
jgi:CubicO group peptidase (beta-lactamase class C family)